MDATMERRRDAQDVPNAGSIDDAQGVREAEDTAEAPLSAEDRFAADYLRSNKLIFKEYSQHEIYYNVLKATVSESDEHALCEQIAAFPQMRVSLRTPRFYLDGLFETGALRREPLEDEAGDDPAADTSEVDGMAAEDLEDETVAGGTSDSEDGAAGDVTPAQDGADAADAAAPAAPAAPRPITIEHYRWYPTEVGEQLVADLSPSIRLSALIAEDEQAWPIYREVLEFCRTPRKRTEIEQRLDGMQLLEGLGVLTSFFLDRLEQNGGLVWDAGWVTTPEGDTVLQSRKKDSDWNEEEER